MKIGVVSDTHGSLIAWQRALRTLGAVDMLLHAGDVLYYGPRNPLPDGHDAPGLAQAMNAYQGRLVVARGNCDADVDQRMLDVPVQAPYAFVVAGGRHIMIHHGHLVAYEDMPALMTRYRLNLLVTGHTHIPRITRVSESPAAIILNPGSPALPKTQDGRGTVAVVDDAGIRILFVDDGSEMTSCPW